MLLGKDPSKWDWDMILSTAEVGGAHASTFEGHTRRA